MSVDGTAAAATMLAFGTWRPGYCLEAVWQAYKRNGARSDRDAATAYIGWQKSGGKHHGDRNPPPGVPVWFGPKSTSSAGDVVISLGGGRVIATDWPRNGVIGETTIDARQRQIGRPYLGWTEDILGASISLPTPADSGESSTPNEGFLMALSDFQQKQIYDALVVPTAAGAYYRTDAAINVMRGELAPAIASIAAGGILFPGQGYLAFPALANVVREDGGQGDLDEAEIAAALAPALAPLIATNLGTLNDETIDELIRRLLAEQADRLAAPARE